MRLRSLESRIVALFLFLILAVQLAGFFAIRSGIEKNARASIKEELVIGEHVFRRLLDQNAQKLTLGARLLAADYGFRQAVGSNDQETIASALDNHGARIGAALTMLVGADHQIEATTAQNLAGNLQRAILALVATAEQRGNATDIGIVDNYPYQIVVVPVNAPLVIGWVVMAFPIDQKLIAQMHELSSLQVAILTSGAQGGWMPGVSTLTATDTASLAAQLGRMSTDSSMLPDLKIADSQFSARVLRLARQSGQTTIAVLQRSVSEAIAPYRQLQLTLLILTAAGIVLAVIGSIFMARRITGPLRQLTQTARQLGEGDYHAAIVIRRDDEIGALSKIV
ncbi:cache domain-containing protein [Undibacterium arcticum]